MISLGLPGSTGDLPGAVMVEASDNVARLTLVSEGAEVCGAGLLKLVRDPL